MSPRPLNVSNIIFNYDTLTKPRELDFLGRCENFADQSIFKISCGYLFLKMDEHQIFRENYLWTLIPVKINPIK